MAIPPNKILMMRNTTGGCPPPSISRKAKVFVVRFFCIVFYHDPQHISSEYVHTLTAFEKLLLFKGWPTGPLRKGTSQIRLDGYDPGSSSRSMDHIRPRGYRHPCQPSAGSRRLQRWAQKIHQPQYQIHLPLLRHHHPGNPRG